jgi:CheY-like chemotaxis protein
MSLDALIVSRDPDVINVFRNVMEAAAINVDETKAVGESLVRLAKRRYDAVVVDCDGVPDGADVIEALRKGKSNRSSITFAVVERGSDTSKIASKYGATFVLQKPISTDAVMKSIKASHSLIVREKRRYMRHPVDTYAHVQVGQESEMQVAVTDISEGGMSVTAPVNKKLSGAGTLRLIMPEDKAMVQGKIEIMWTRADGKAGVRFITLTGQSKDELIAWLGARSDIAGWSRAFATKR